MSLFPTKVAAMGFKTLEEVRDWVGVDVVAVEAFEEKTGKMKDKMRNMALLPRGIVHAALGAAEYAADKSHLTPMDAAQVGLMWRICKRLAVGWNDPAWVDEDPCLALVAPASQAAAAPAPQTRKRGRVIKISDFLDQGDSTEIEVASPAQVKIWQENWRKFALGPPLSEENPIPDQLSVLNARVNLHDGSPAVDFAIWTPYARKTGRASKFTAFLPQPDGTWISREVPGPSNLSGWKYCWRVFRCAAIMLDMIPETALMEYQRTMERLVADWPECWHLVYVADDKARWEYWEQKVRQIESEIASGAPAPHLWDPAKPWGAALFAMARDDRYWDHEVRHPAVSWMSHGRHGSLKTREELIASVALSGGSAALNAQASAPAGAQLTKDEADTTPWGPAKIPRLSKGARKAANRAAAALAEQKATAIAAHQSQWDKNGHGKGAKGKGKGKDIGKAGKGKDANGTQICYSYNNGDGPCGQCGPGSTCPNSRSHVCSFCGGAHRSKDCTVKSY